MKLKKNPKKFLYKILNKKKTFIIDKKNKKYSGKKILEDVNNLIYYLREKKINQIIEFNLQKKYYSLIVLLSCLFNNLRIYPNIYKKKIFEESYFFNSDDVIKKILLKKNKKKNNYDFKDSKYLILETSGSTGEKKKIQFNAYNYLNACIHSTRLFNYDKKSKILHCLPIFYNAGINNLLFSGLFGSSEIVFSENLNIFNFKKILKISIFQKINSIQLMPSMYMIINSNNSHQTKKFIKKLKSIISTGSYLYTEINKIFKSNFRKNISSCYGITEMGGALTLQKNINKFKSLSVGKIIKPIKLKINKKRELLINTTFKMEGYFGVRSNYIKKLKKNSFFNTKDLAYLKKNELFITGRNKEMIKRGGENISLKNIEDVAIKSGLINDAFCFGKKNIYSDEDIYLAINLKRKFSKIYKEKFYNHLLINLEKNSLPKQIIYMIKFPYFQSGKLDRLQLKKQIEN